MSRVVAGRGKRRDSRSELHVTRDGLEAVEERLDRNDECAGGLPASREREGVGVHGVPRSGKEDVALEVRVPAQVIDVQVREEDEVDAVAGDAELREGDGKQPLVLRGPVPEARRPDPGVDQNRRPRRADEEGIAREPPGLAGEELRI